MVDKEQQYMIKQQVYIKFGYFPFISENKTKNKGCQ